jgi:hypothetical protein
MATGWDGVPWEVRCAACRARVLALRELVAEGQPVENWQLARAVEPIIGDLVPLTASPPKAEEGEEARLRRWQRLALEDMRAALRR